MCRAFEYRIAPSPRQASRPWMSLLPDRGVCSASHFCFRFGFAGLCLPLPSIILTALHLPVFHLVRHGCLLYLFMTAPGKERAHPFRADSRQRVLMPIDPRPASLQAGATSSAVSIFHLLRLCDWPGHLAFRADTGTMPMDTHHKVGSSSGPCQSILTTWIFLAL